MKRLMIILTVLVSVSINMHAKEPETVIDRISFHGYDNQGPFVTGPTTCGNYLGMGIGSIPASVFYGLTYLAGVSEPNRNNIAFYTTKGVTLAFGAAIGAPFLAIKAVAWDAPKYLFEGLSPYEPEEVEAEPKDRKQVQEKIQRAK